MIYIILLFFNIYIFLNIYFNFIFEILLFLCVLYHSYLSFFSLPLVCDAFLSQLLLSNVTAYIHGNVNAFLSSPVIAYMFTVLLLYLIYATEEDSLELLKRLIFSITF